jgi:hypothetical protein
MRILVLGGGRFVGPSIIAAAIVRGWEVAAFNRSQTSSVPPGAKTIVVASPLRRSHLEVATPLARAALRAGALAQSRIKQNEAGDQKSVRPSRSFSRERALRTSSVCTVAAVAAIRTRTM